MILHHADGIVLCRQPQHQLDEIAPRSIQATWPEYPGRTNDERSVQVGLRIQLACEFGDRIRP